MVRIIIQRHFNTSFKCIKALKKAFKISWLKAMYLYWKIHKGYGLVLITDQHDYCNTFKQYAEKVYSDLNVVNFELSWKENLQGIGAMIPRNKFEFIHKFNGLNIYIALERGYIDDLLNIY